MYTAGGRDAWTNGQVASNNWPETGDLLSFVTDRAAVMLQCCQVTSTRSSQQQLLQQLCVAVDRTAFDVITDVISIFTQTRPHYRSSSCV